MKKWKILFLISILFFWKDVSLAKRRMVSTSPAITESIFDLGLGNLLVGVSDYCQYPGEVKSLTRIGSSLTPNYEGILKLKPDLVFIQKIENQSILNSFKKLKLEVEVLNFNRLRDILESYLALSKKLKTSKKGEQFVERVQKELSKLPLFLNPESYLIVTHAQLGGKKIKSVSLAGEKTHYSDILSGIGLNNLAQGLVPSPQWDREKIIQSKPDWIFILFPSHFSQARVSFHTQAWRELKKKGNIENAKLRILHGDFAFIPGPRVILLIQELRKQLIL